MNIMYLSNYPKLVRKYSVRKEVLLFLLLSEGELISELLIKVFKKRKVFKKYEKELFN